MSTGLGETESTLGGHRQGFVHTGSQPRVVNSLGAGVGPMGPGGSPVGWLWPIGGGVRTVVAAIFASRPGSNQQPTAPVLEHLRQNNPQERSHTEVTWSLC